MREPPKFWRVALLLYWIYCDIGIYKPIRIQVALLGSKFSPNFRYHLYGVKIYHSLVRPTKGKQVLAVILPEPFFIFAP
ncbi:unnamed protein product [Callosobruchus maculatus]|uniref:Uncharacterized protein n=1 Tax=Callosobruchus maculatus TaxID=64391 RepID=A0A653DF71_CALMS|nr:unnamed protein product [Callosobruchus maculatus]